MSLRQDAVAHSVKKRVGGSTTTYSRTFSLTLDSPLDIVSNPTKTLYNRHVNGRS